jgi:sugar/nucleoside kinase (ribokinase family)
MTGTIRHGRPSVAEPGASARRRRGGSRHPEIVLIGSASRDAVADDPRGWRLGGGVTYSALTTARLGLRTAAIVGVDAAAAAADELDLLRDAGVDLHLVRLPHGPVFRNLETPDGRVQTCLDPGVPLPDPCVPETWRGAPAWILAPVANEIGTAWAAALPPDAYVAVGWQGLLRELRAGQRVTRRAAQASVLIARADLVATSRHDVATGTPLEILAALLHPGAQLLVTRGRKGGLLLTADANGVARTLRYRSSPADREVDSTGSGDTFLAALVATVVDGGMGGSTPHPGEAGLRFAAAAGSLVVEAPGLAGVPDRTAVLARIARDEASVAPGATGPTRAGPHDEG